MKIERPRLGGVFLSVVVRRGDRFFPGTLFQDRHRRPQAAGEPEICMDFKSNPCRGPKLKNFILSAGNCRFFRRPTRTLP